MQEFDDDDEYYLDDDALNEFCQDNDSQAVDTQHLRIDHTAKIVFDEKTDALACMIEHAIMTIVNDIIETADILEETFSETDVMILHTEKHDKTILIALDVYSDKRGIAVRQTCEGTIKDGEVIFS